MAASARDLCGALALLLLRAVTAASLLAALDTLGVERAADDLVTNAGKVLHPATAHQHDGVLLQVVTLARDVGGDLDLAGQTNASHLAERRVRLLGGRRVDAGTNTATLRTSLESRRLCLAALVLPALPDQLLDSWHLLATSFCLVFVSRVLSSWWPVLEESPRTRTTRDEIRVQGPKHTTMAKLDRAYQKRLPQIAVSQNDHNLVRS